MNNISFIEAFAVALCSVFSTFWFNSKGPFSKIQSSSLSSFIFMLLIYLNHHFQIFKFNEPEYSVLFYGATFIGMTSSKVGKEWTLFLASFIYTLIFFAGKEFFPTLGGKLGFIAGISVFISIGLRSIVRMRWK